MKSSPDKDFKKCYSVCFSQRGKIIENFVINILQRDFEIENPELSAKKEREGGRNKSFSLVVAYQQNFRSAAYGFARDATRANFSIYLNSQFRFPDSSFRSHAVFANFESA